MLLVRTGSLAGQRLPVRKSLVTLGRGSHNDLQLPDPSVGLSHARVELRQGIWILTPLGVSNLTRVDGETALEEMPLSPGSVILLGDVSLFFEPRDRPEARALPRGAVRKPEAGRRRFRFWRRLLITLAVLLGALLLLATLATELS